LVRSGGDNSPVTLLAVHKLGQGSLPPDMPVLHADDEGFLRGRAVFETVRVYGGTPFRLDAHLARLTASAERVGLPAPDVEGLGAAAADAIAVGGEPDATLRLLWTSGREGSAAPTGLALVSSLPRGLDELRTRGLRLATVPWFPGALAGAKSTSYAENMAAVDEAVRRGADDALLVGPDGAVLEAPTSNVWFREGDRLLTPSLALPLLAGVTRAALLELAPQAGYDVEEGTFELGRLLDSDEVFLTSSVREVMPAASIDGRALELGPAATELQRALRAAAGVP
jgi:branched-subunit amino acid aminotransferase/4-amino-4-deoxychorismate lyase